MNKSELLIDHVEKINHAVEKGLGGKDWEFVGFLSGGLTGVPVYKIEIENKAYAIKLENVDDKNFDLVRNYKIIDLASKQGISPLVYFTDAERGVILMEYIAIKPRPEVSPESIKKFAGIIRNLHEVNIFPSWKSVTEILSEIGQTFPEAYRQNNIIKKCLQEVKELEGILFDERDVRSCHCDLNPANILFNGESYFLVDWQAASPQSFYFDLAYVATWFYFYSEDLCVLFLTSYLGRQGTQEEKAKYYLMRVFTNIYLGIGFLALPLKRDKSFPELSNENIEKLPSYLEFLQSIGMGKVNLSDPNVQQQFGFVFLKSAEKMMNEQYKIYSELLAKQGF